MNKAEPRTTDHESKRWSIRSLLGQLFEDHFVSVAQGALPTKQLEVWGEVLAIGEGKSKRFLTLADAFDVRLALTARLVKTCPLPAVGDMVCVQGSLRVQTKQRPPTVELVLDGTAIIENKGPSRRNNERRRGYADLAGRYPIARRLTRCPRKVAVVTAENSRAWSDVVRVLERQPVLRDGVEMVPTVLDKPEAIAEALKHAGELDVDLIVLTRGGGHPSELALFNDLAIAEALAQVSSRTPVIFAVGHATDTLPVARFASYVDDTPTSAGNRVLGLYGRFFLVEPPKPEPKPQPVRRGLHYGLLWALAGAAITLIVLQLLSWRG